MQSGLQERDLPRPRHHELRRILKPRVSLAWALTNLSKNRTRQVAFSRSPRRPPLSFLTTAAKVALLVKLSLMDRWDLFRYGPSGRRFQFVRQVCEALRNNALPANPQCFDIGEFKSFEHFEIKYRQLAEELGHAGKIPAPGEVEFLQRVVDLDGARYPGGIGSRDSFFLTALISILAPRRVVEIGTLTGFSTAVIAAAIDRQHGKASPPITVETIDADTHCMIDRTRPIGFEIPELVPDLVSKVLVHTGQGSDFVSELAHPGEFGLAFIDADHRHPWPLLDVLRLAPYVQKSGWIGLHDIQLGTYWKELKETGQSQEAGAPYGAEWLFERWPFRKIRSFHIGAVELPSRKDALIPFALSLMEEPFEVTGKTAERTRRAIYESFAELV
jgi:predicted O-methyltransferase YrrM